MDKSAIKKDILSALSEELDSWLESQEAITDGYEYESKYMKFAQKMNKIVFEKSLGRLPGSRNKKNSIPVLEKQK
jgi:hypothetical protein